MFLRDLTGNWSVICHNTGVGKNIEDNENYITIHILIPSKAIITHFMLVVFDVSDQALAYRVY